MAALLKICEGVSPNVRSDGNWSEDFQSFVGLCCLKTTSLRPSAAHLLQHNFLKGEVRCPEEEVSEGELAIKIVVQTMITKSPLSKAAPALLPIAGDEELCASASEKDKKKLLTNARVHGNPPSSKKFLGQKPTSPVRSGRSPLLATNLSPTPPPNRDGVGRVKALNLGPVVNNGNSNSNSNNSGRDGSPGGSNIGNSSSPSSGVVSPSRSSNNSNPFSANAVSNIMSGTSNLAPSNNNNSSSNNSISSNVVDGSPLPLGQPPSQRLQAGDKASRVAATQPLSVGSPPPRRQSGLTQVTPILLH